MHSARSVSGRSIQRRRFLAHVVATTWKACWRMCGSFKLMCDIHRPRAAPSYSRAQVQTTTTTFRGSHPGFVLDAIRPAKTQISISLSGWDPLELRTPTLSSATGFSHPQSLSSRTSRRPMAGNRMWIAISRSPALHKILRWAERQEGQIFFEKLRQAAGRSLNSFDRYGPPTDHMSEPDTAFWGCLSNCTAGEAKVLLKQAGRSKLFKRGGALCDSSTMAATGNSNS